MYFSNLPFITSASIGDFHVAKSRRVCWTRENASNLRCLREKFAMRSTSASDFFSLFFFLFMKCVTLTSRWHVIYPVNLHARKIARVIADGGWWWGKGSRKRRAARCEQASPENSTPDKIGDRGRLISRCIEFCSLIFFVLSYHRATDISFIVNASSFAMCEIFRSPRSRLQFPRPRAPACRFRVRLCVAPNRVYGANNEYEQCRRWFYSYATLAHRLEIRMLFTIYYLHYFAHISYNVAQLTLSW